MRPPRKSILSRYDQTDDGKIIVDITTSRIEDLYNHLDRLSPYSRKDLAGNVSHYLLECAREIHPEPFVIRLSFTHEPSFELVGWVRNSIGSFFCYLEEVEKRRIRGMLRTSLLLLTVGITILVGVVWINRILPTGRGVLLSVFVEGLTVAGWVAMWESLASFLVLWIPRRNEIKLLRRVAEAPVLLATSKQTDPKRNVGAA
ncbi:MAG: hypothetical protein JXA11_05275 [Phycisphaerae bacterium]|nr:hypothetical protein [Phycisphaerae bacterium]